jgi:glutamyl-tRNA synthetase
VFNLEAHYQSAGIGWPCLDDPPGGCSRSRPRRPRRAASTRALMAPRARAVEPRSDALQCGAILRRRPNTTRPRWRSTEGRRRAHLTALEAAFVALPAFDASSSEAALRSVADSRGVKAGALIHAVRVALTGRTVSPGLFDVATLLGRNRTLERLGAALRMSV